MQQNRQEMMRAAHTLKGISAAFGAIALAKTCQTLEAIEKDDDNFGSHPEVLALLPQLESEYQAMKVVLSQKQQSLQVQASPT